MCNIGIFVPQSSQAGSVVELIKALLDGGNCEKVIDEFIIYRIEDVFEDIVTTITLPKYRECSIASN